ncbi:hypothetical protein, partial [Achromobacter xylosoxidans]|uniref:hypothetical protein n=1 Tax=Alcaligenes xylosoxydans xylosoxydans TaxID=85698 RepID=UPI0022B8FD16
RLCADDSGRTSVKVGHRQAFIAQNPTGSRLWGFVFMKSPFMRAPRLSSPALIVANKAGDAIPRIGALAIEAGCSAAQA